MTKQDTYLLLLMLIDTLIVSMSKIFRHDLKSWRQKIFNRIAKEVVKDPNAIIFTGCRSAITGEIFSVTWIDTGCAPLISDQGFLIVCHGNPDGTVMIGNGKGGLMSVRIDDNRFTDIFNPNLPPITVIACYPGARPTMWKHNGRMFYTPKGDRTYVPMFCPTLENGTMICCPMSYELALALKLI